MKKLIFIFILTGWTSAYSARLHLKFTNSAYSQIQNLHFGEVGDNSLYMKIKLINKNWFWKSPFFSLWHTEESWGNKHAMTLNCNNFSLYYHERKRRYIKEVDPDKAEHLTVEIDIDDLISPDFELYFFNNNQNFRTGLPGMIKQENLLPNTLLFITLDYDDDLGFFYPDYST